MYQTHNGAQPVFASEARASLRGCKQSDRCWPPSHLSLRALWAPRSCSKHRHKPPRKRITANPALRSISSSDTSHINRVMVGLDHAR